MISAARRTAFDVLWRVEAQAAYASELLHTRLKGETRREDAALATELTLGVLRWQRRLDFEIARQLSRPVESLDAEVRLALRMGLYQLRWLSRVPARAAISESVELVKRARKKSAAGLVNAVLRRAAAERYEIEPALASVNPLAERLGIQHSHPTWIVERWLERFGEGRTTALLEANNEPPRTTYIVNDPVHADEVVESLERARIRIEPGQWLRAAWRARGGSLADTPAFHRGWISMQDEASQMVALLLGVEPSQSVLDVCAAPGGKTALLARAAGPAGIVVAADVNTRRLQLARDNLARLQLKQVKWLAMDAAATIPFADTARFDRILVDAPCSGTGTLARNPEIRWKLRKEDLGELHRRQVAMLRRALEHLARGGRLVYATCSLEQEENEDAVVEALAGCQAIARVDGAKVLGPHMSEGVLPQELFDSAGFFRTLPSEHGTDGFFAAVFERRAL